MNVDFDVLYSDPAPLEALLQRFGRVNRARLAPSRVVNVCRQIPAGSPVYDEGLVTKAVQALEQWHGKVLAEDVVRDILDSIYGNGLGDRLASKIKQRMLAFERDVLAPCRPFQSDEKLEQMFEDLFDGFEVLPAAFLDEFKRRCDEQPLLAPGLLVPVTRGQFRSLQSRGLIGRELNTWVANCSYTGRGLEIHSSPAEDSV